MVTYERRTLFPEYARFLHYAISKISSDKPFEVVAWSILPDHVHYILNPGDHDLSHLIRRIKLIFSHRYPEEQSLYRARVWQARFWDHIIRDENDLNHHIDYIHYNPVKHGLVKNPSDWAESSIHDYRAQGVYQADWGSLEELDFSGEYGE
jgi:putative transposase